MCNGARRGRAQRKGLHAKVTTWKPHQHTIQRMPLTVQPTVETEEREVGASLDVRKEPTYMAWNNTIKGNPDCFRERWSRTLGAQKTAHWVLSTSFRDKHCNLQNGSFCEVNDYLKLIKMDSVHWRGRRTMLSWSFWFIRDTEKP